MSIKQSEFQNFIAVRTADDAAQKMIQIGGSAREAIVEWRRVYSEVQLIARKPDVDTDPR